MSNSLQQLGVQLEKNFPDAILSVELEFGELTIEVKPKSIKMVCQSLCDTYDFSQLTDLCGVDYLSYGQDEWDTESVTNKGFSRGVEAVESGRFTFDDTTNSGDTIENRFAVVYHLLSIKRNQRIRIKAFCVDSDFPVIDSVIDIWNSADWYEREAFDLFGIVFAGHPDLRRILTDYGFIGHPFRKDFPLIGNVEMRYDAEKKRVVYQPVTIEPRVLVPRVIRDDHRYAAEEVESTDG